MLRTDKALVEAIATQKAAEAVAGVKVKSGGVSQKDFDALKKDHEELKKVLAGLKGQLKKVLK